MKIEIWIISLEYFEAMENELTLKRFIDLRRELGYTQADFAALIGVSNTTADIERGRTKLSDTSWYQQLPAFDLPIPEFRNATYRGFQVEGDSMLPNLHPGEWVLARAIEHIDYTSANKMYVVVLQDSIMVKKIEKRPNSNDVTLISLNETYPPYDIKPFQIQEIWEVSSKITFNVDATTDSGLLRQLQESMDELKNQLQHVKKVN
mgnify:CR=1 FL=1